MLGDYGKVLSAEFDFKRYVGAQIGIYNPQGVKVGKVDHLRNKEYVFVVTRDGEPASRALDAALPEQMQLLA